MSSPSVGFAPNQYIWDAIEAVPKLVRFARRFRARNTTFGREPSRSVESIKNNHPGAC
jgi:hypothetical protein